MLFFYYICDMVLSLAIKQVLSYESTKAKWRNDHGSVEFKEASKLASVIMGEPLQRKKNCGCVEDLFYMLKNMTDNNIKLKEKNMESQFKIKKGVMIMNHKLSDPITFDNLTDERALELLKINPKSISLFSEFPENWEELLHGKKPKKLKEVKAEIEEKVEEEVEYSLRVEADNIADLRGLKRPHWKATEEKLFEFISRNK